VGNHRPKWRLPFVTDRATSVYQSPLFKAKRFNIQNAKKCEAIARTTGKQCGQIALRGSTRCRRHGGLKQALIAEAERHGRPVIANRAASIRMKALIDLAITTPWPPALPRLPQFDKMSKVARGRLFEAYFNRETDPETYKHELTRPR